ncbi:MAG TPA: dethiobiotin synthase [Usitatibacter sp.]|nr:dethiobiotin synthase [Usitatibacter sp.]
MTRGIFVTGTDTAVGKTLACCALIRALGARGLRVMPMKPVAAGTVERFGREVNEDSLALIEAAGQEAALLADVTPVLLKEPMAPHIAAAREGRRIALAPILSAFERLSAAADFVVVEGVGGFFVPLGDEIDSIDLARALDLPVVLVVGLRLGCLNHALLSAQAIEATGLPFAGWIANAIDPTMAVAEENVAALVARLRAPLLGRLPFQAPPDARHLAPLLDTNALLHRA